MEESLPKLCNNGKVLYLTCAFPPVPAGSSIINRNLLSRFDPSSFTVFTTKANIDAKVESFKEFDVKTIFKSFYFSSKANYYLSGFQIKGAIRKIVNYAKENKPKVLVSVFPDYYFLKITVEASRELKIPFIAYLHDTISESAYGGKLYEKSMKLQEDVFKEASAIFVMSEGMKNLYKDKYSIDTIPLQHTYLEPVKNEIASDNLKPQAFWGGDIYGINVNSVKRVSEALKNNNYRFFFATGYKQQHFDSMGFDVSNIDIGFFSKRKEYLDNISKYGILVLALDWPDESSVHKDELATIFPTKTPEYLATGAPILVHCPSDYFMAQFFMDNDCGVVVTERDPVVLDEAIKNIVDNPDVLLTKRKNALKAAEIFNAQKLSGLFKSVVDEVSNLNWGDKIDYKKNFGS